MARPKHASDQQVLSAAHRIYSERGHRGFTLSELARDVDLSRAALIQRFGNVESLRMRLARERAGRLRQLLAELPVERSGDALIALAAFIGSMVEGRSGLASYMQAVQADLDDAELIHVEKERGAALSEAVACRMPELPIDNQSAALAFRAHLAGSLMQWQVEERPISARDFLVERTREWLRLVRLPFGDEVISYEIPASV